MAENGATSLADNGHAQSDETPQMVSLDAFMTAVSTQLITSEELPAQADIAEQAAAGARIQVLTFVLDDTRYAIDINYTREVIREPLITPVPGLPSWVAGVTNFHGDILSVVNMKAFLNLEENDPSLPDTMIAAHAADQTIGLLVDDVGLIASMPDDMVISPPFPVSPELVPYLHGAIDRDREFIRFIDCERLLLGQQMQQFS